MYIYRISRIIFFIIFLLATASSENPTLATSPVDINLSHFNPNLLYAEVYNMSQNPQNYIGKTIKLIGQFGYYQKFDNSGRPLPESRIPICIIGDAMGCCWIEIRLMPINEAEFFQNYPAHDSTIVITGICDITYNQQLQSSSLLIRQADIQVIK